MSHPVYQLAQQSGAVIQWRLRRNCPVTLAQLGWLFLTWLALSLAIGTFFWPHGRPLILAFAGLEVALIGLALWLYDRHASDGEWISLQGSNLVVEHEFAGHRQRAEFGRQWVRVEPKLSEHSLIELSGQGRSIEVGRFVRPELRQVLAREIRRALRSA